MCSALGLPNKSTKSCLATLELQMVASVSTGHGAFAGLREWVKNCPRFIDYHFDTKNYIFMGVGLGVIGAGMIHVNDEIVLVAAEMLAAILTPAALNHPGRPAQDRRRRRRMRYEKATRSCPNQTTSRRTCARPCTPHKRAGGRLLKDAMQKLTNVESQRMMAVMGDLLDRLNYLTYVPLDPQTALLAALRSGRCLNAAELLREHWRWEQLFLQAVDALDSRADDIGDQVRVTVRALCRDLRDSPVAVETLFHFGTGAHDRSEELQALVRALSELTDLTRVQLDRTLEDAKSKKELMGVAESRLRQAEDERAAIRDKLAEMRRVKEEELALLDAQVQKLRNELHAMNQSATHELSVIDAELKEAQSKAHEHHSQEMKLLMDKAAALQVQAAKMAQEHQEEEDVLRKKKCKAAAEVAAVVGKYDADMATMETEIQDVERTLEAERITCQELHEHFIKIDEEQTRIEAEERVLEQIRAREREKQQFIHNSATKIQKVYRGVLTRREYAKIVAKTKKGGGKKGKKGKAGKK